jgi:hypothetical protein
VVVDVRLPQMLLVRILVRLVLVGQGGMVVLVVVLGHQVGDVLPRPVVMRDVDVPVYVHDSVVVVGLSHASSSADWRLLDHRTLSTARRRARPVELLKIAYGGDTLEPRVRPYSAVEAEGAAL